MDAGIKLTINADAPAFLNTNVQKEFKLLIDAGIIQEDDVDGFLQNAHDASFIKKNILY